MRWRLPAAGGRAGRAVRRSRPPVPGPGRGGPPLARPPSSPAPSPVTCPRARLQQGAAGRKWRLGRPGAGRCAAVNGPPNPLISPPSSHPRHAPAAPRRLRRAGLPGGAGPRRQGLGAGPLGEQPARHPRQPQPALGREDAALRRGDAAGPQRGARPRGGRARRR